MQQFKVKKKKYIALPTRYNKLLIQEFGVTSECVRQALIFASDSEQAEAIRVRALAMGGFIAFKAV